MPLSSCHKPSPFLHCHHLNSSNPGTLYSVDAMALCTTICSRYQLETPHCNAKADKTVDVRHNFPAGMKYWNNLLGFSQQFCFHLLYPLMSKSPFLKNAVCFLREYCLNFVLFFLPVLESTASRRFSAIEEGVKSSDSNSKSHSCSSKDLLA